MGCRRKIATLSEPSHKGANRDDDGTDSNQHRPSRSRGTGTFTESSDAESYFFLCGAHGKLRSAEAISHNADMHSDHRPIPYILPIQSINFLATDGLIFPERPLSRTLCNNSSELAPNSFRAAIRLAFAASNSSFALISAVSCRAVSLLQMRVYSFFFGDAHGKPPTKMWDSPSPR